MQVFFTTSRNGRMTVFPKMLKFYEKYSDLKKKFFKKEKHTDQIM